MKHTLLRVLSLLLCAAALCGSAFAAETDSEPLRPGPVRVWGTLTRLEDGALLVKNDDTGEGLSEVILRGESILCLDAVTGEPMDLDDIRDGETVYAWAGPVMTMSLPPQGTALLILGNIPADYAVPQFYEIVSVTPQAQIAVYPPPALTWTEVTATDGTVLTITDGAELTPYLTKNIVRLEDLVPGTRILVWRDGGDVSRVLVFPYAYDGYLSCGEDGTVLVNGGAVAQKARSTQEGDTLLPLRAVAEALGLTVEWVPGTGAVVTENGVRTVTAVPGGPVTGVDGMGASYEAGGTCLVDAGVTYLSFSALVRLLNLYPAL